MVRFSLPLPEARMNTIRIGLFACAGFVMMALSPALLAGPAGRESCADDARNAVNAIRGELGLTGAKIALSADIVCEIESSEEGAVDVVAAARKAINSFLTDSRDIESPLALAIEVAFNEAGLPVSEPVPPEVAESARQMLLAELASSKTTVRLTKAGDEAEHGEKSGPNWVFRMTSKGLSDHIFWAIVDRSGKVPVYNYGFN